MCQHLMAIQVPVAVSMIQFAERAEHPFHEFICYWTALNNIYAIVAAGAHPDPIVPKRKKKDKEVCGIQIPDFRSNEGDQIIYIRSQFCPDLKDELIKHESTKWFISRTPKWDGQEIQQDALGNKLNGVINVGFTFDAASPSWSPICATDYHSYISNPQPQTRDNLVEQLIDVLYTIRNNLIHAGKQPDDANDKEVTEKAVPLLQIIISHFLQSPQN